MSVPHLKIDRDFISGLTEIQGEGINSLLTTSFAMLIYKVGPSVDQSSTTNYSYMYTCDEITESAFTLIGEPQKFDATPGSPYDRVWGHKIIETRLAMCPGSIFEMRSPIAIHPYNGNATAYTGIRFKSTSRTVQRIICVNKEVYADDVSGLKIGTCDSADWEINLGVQTLSQFGTFLTPLIIKYPGGCMTMTYLNEDENPGTVFTFYTITDDSAAFYVPLAIIDSPLDYGYFKRLSINIDQLISIETSEHDMGEIAFDKYAITGKGWAHVLKRRTIAYISPKSPTSAVTGLTVRGDNFGVSSFDLVKRIEDLEANQQGSKSSFVVI